MFSKYDYEDLKLAEKYLIETEDFKIYYYDQIRNDNNELIISGYIVLKRKWYTKELYMIEYDYNFDKKEFYSIIPSEYHNGIERLELTEDYTIFTKDEMLESIQNGIDDILTKRVIEYESYSPFAECFTPPSYEEIFKQLSEISKKISYLHGILIKGGRLI